MFSFLGSLFLFTSRWFVHTEFKGNLSVFFFLIKKIFNLFLRERGTVYELGCYLDGEMLIQEQ